MTGQVAGKVALVTGGASGIGAAVAELLAREGASVAATDIDELGGPEIVAGIRKAGGEAIFLPQDVTSEARWIEVVAEVEKRYGRLDILVSNAGIGIAVPSITDMTLEDWRRQNAINLDGVFLSVKHCLPAMRRSGGGSIIMMSSLAGLRGAPGLPIARAKAASGCSPSRSRWNAHRQATAFGSTRCIPALSTRRYGAKFQREPRGGDRTRRSIRKSAQNWLLHSVAPATPRKSQAAYCIWRPMHQAT